MSKTRRRTWFGVIAAGGVTAAVALGALAYDGKKPARVPLPDVPIVQGEKCVEPTDVMRKQHMQFILHQRDDTMHQGIRTVKHSLKGCVNCHADPKTNSVVGKDGFCESCHTYAAVTIDCFSCHTSKREPGTGPAAAEATDLKALMQASGLRPLNAEAHP